MKTSVALFATRLAVFCALFALVAPTPAVAQVTNSGFDSGGAGWGVFSPPGWTADFPSSGGNPGFYGRLQSPSVGSGGKAWFRQGFVCGSGHFCNIRFDYRLEPIAASPGSARVEVWTNGVLRSTLASPTGASWRTASLSVSCGPNVALDLCLEVDAGSNAWRASFDNVRADCSEAPPGTTSQRFDAPGSGSAYTVMNHSGDAARVLEETVVSPLGEEFQVSFLRLAHPTPSNLNTVAFDRTASGAYRTITADFDFRMTPDRTSRADGFGFALLNTANYGAAGAAPAFAEEPNLSGSLGVGFDIYQNPGEVSDNHVSLHWDGTLFMEFPIDKSVLDLADGFWHHATVTVTPIPGEPGEFISAIIIDGTVSASYALYWADYFLYESRAAFGARTGGLWAAHDLDDVSIRWTDLSPVDCRVPSRMVYVVQQAQNLGQTSVPDDGTVFEIIQGVPTGAVGHSTSYVAIVSDIPGTSGVQAWSLSASVTGDLVVESVGYVGPIVQPSYDLTEVVDPTVIHPDTGLPQGQGFVAATVLSFTQPVVLNPLGTATVVEVEVAADHAIGSGETITGKIGWRDNMISPASGLPVLNRVNIDGGTYEFCRLGELDVTFVSSDHADGFNPNGFIQGSGWNLLFPLVNSLGCTAGGPESMKRNWVAPHVIGEEDPKAGDVWGDIDFGRTAATTGWGGQGLNPDPIWFTIASLAERIPPIWDFGEADTVDYKGIVDLLNQSKPDDSGFPSNNTLALATTYVDNRSGAPLAVDLLTTSEDSLQVWVNNALVVNRSLCPTLLNDPTPTACFLPPGVSKIATLCWNGTGRWNFRLGIRRSSDGHLYTDADAGELAFLGPGDAATRGQQQYIVERELAGKPVDFSCSDSAVVRLQGSGPGDPDDLVTVVEHIKVEDVEGLAGNLVLTDIEPTAEVAEVAIPYHKVITWRRVPRSAVTAGLSYRMTVRSGAIESQHSGHVEGETVTQGIEGVRLQTIVHGTPVGPIFEDHHAIGQPACETMPPLAYEASTGSYTMSACGSGPGPEGDDFHFAYQQVTGDFVAEARVLSPPVLRKQLGLIARYTCDADAKFSAILGPGDDVKHVHRSFHRDAGSYREDYVAAPTDPMASVWLRMVRLGNAIYTYAAPDEAGEPGPWCLIGSDSHAERQETLLVGMAASSEAESPAKPVDFDHLSIEPLAPSFPPDPESLGAADEVLSLDFDSGILPDAVIVRRSGDFTPRAVGGRLRLTEDGTTSSATAVWFPNPTGDLPAGSGFIAEFDAYAIPIESLSPAGDGFTFAVVQAMPDPNGGKPVDFKPVDFSTLCGDPGGALGYEGGTIRERAPCHPSFAVELDTYVNEPGEGPGAPQNEPSGTNAVGVLGNYHVGLDVNGSVSSLQTNWLFIEDASEMPDIFSFAGIHVEVRYFPTRPCLPPECDGDGAGAQSPDPIPWHVDVWVSSNAIPDDVPLHVLSARVPELSGELVMGFTAATGGATATFEVDNFSLGTFCAEAPDSVSVSGPTEALVAEVVTLLATGDNGGDAVGVHPEPKFHWAILDGAASILGDPVGPQVLLQAPIAGEVTVQVSYDDGLCISDGPVKAEHTVLFTTSGCVERPDSVSITGPAQARANEVVRVTALGNDGGETAAVTHSYTWTLVRGPGVIAGPSTGETTALAATAAGEVRVRVAYDDGLCPARGPARAEHVVRFTAVSCTELVDSVSISGPVEAAVGEIVRLTALGNDGGEVASTPAYAWTLISGPGVLVGSTTVQPLLLGATATGEVRVRVAYDDGLCPSAGPVTAEHVVRFTEAGRVRPCDANLDGNFDISDAIAVLAGLFGSGRLPCGNGSPSHPSTVLVADCNGDGAVDISDAVFMLSYLFNAGRPPARGTDCLSVAECPSRCR